MPRTGGVYSPPAGTKGVPNTTIQSVPYNTLIDDLTADANAPRPVTAGGTGATSASAARSALGVEIGTNVQAYDPALQSIAGLTTVANQMAYTTGTDLYSTTALTPFARTILDDADAAGVKSTLGLAAVASSGSASDLIVGTVADARLPSSMTGKTFTSQSVISFSPANTAADYLSLRPADMGAGKPGLFFQKSVVASRWQINLWDTSSSAGTLDFSAGTLSWNGNKLLTAAGNDTITGSLAAANFYCSTSGGIYAQGGNLYSEANGNRHLWFRTAGGVNRGLVYQDNSADLVGILLYNNAGSYIRGMRFYQNGSAAWDGNVFTIDAGGTQPELRLYADADSSFRFISSTANGFWLQRSTDRFVSNFTDLMRIDPDNNVVFAGNVHTPIVYTTSNGGGTNIKVGDDAWIGDVNVANSISIRGVSDWNSGYIKFGGGPNLLGVNNAISGDRLVWGSWQLQSDGNQYLPYAGKWLNAALDEKATVYTGGTQDETNFPLGHPLLVSTGNGDIRGRNSAQAVYLSSNYAYALTPDGAQLSGTWRSRGGYDSPGSGAWCYVFVRAA